MGDDISESSIRRSNIDEVLDKIGFGSFHVALIVTIGLSITCDVMEVALIGFIQGCIQKDWHFSDGAEALLAATVFLGQVYSTILILSHYLLKLIFSNFILDHRYVHGFVG